MPEAPETLTVSTRTGSSTAVVALDGDLDLHGVTKLTATVGWLITQRPTAIEVDATNLGFIDSSGLRSLVVARERAGAAGIDLRITRSSAPLDRPWA